MLTFFRRIRKGLIDSNSVRKYAYYAIGEIALVVIGILIALQVNNWNEYRKSQSRIQSHYADLKDEINYNLELWEMHMKQFDDLDKLAIYVRQFLEGEQGIVDTTRLKESFLGAGYYGVFGITRDAYDNLISSGDINLVKNIPLKRKLSSLYAKDGWSQAAQKGMVLNAIEDYEAYKHNFLQPMMMRVYFHNSIFTYNHNEESEKLGTTIDDYAIDWESVKKDKEYSVRLDRLHIIRLNQRNYYLNLKKQMIEIRNDLTNEINN